MTGPSAFRHVDPNEMANAIAMQAIVDANRAHRAAERERTHEPKPALYRVIIRHAYEARGRPFLRFTHNYRTGNVNGYQRQRPKLGRAPVYTRADAERLAETLRPLMYNGATITIRREAVIGR